MSRRRKGTPMPASELGFRAPPKNVVEFDPHEFESENQQQLEFLESCFVDEDDDRIRRSDFSTQQAYNNALAKREHELWEENGSRSERRARFYEEYDLEMMREEYVAENDIYRQKPVKEIVKVEPVKQVKFFNKKA